jgi:hypothetical protein
MKLKCILLGSNMILKHWALNLMKNRNEYIGTACDCILDFSKCRLSKIDESGLKKYKSINMAYR